MSTKKENKIRTVKFISLIVLLFSFGFGSIALAAVTISSTGITGDSSFNTITGVVSSTIDVGSGQTLSLQTVGNGPINTGSGTFTVNGSLTLAGISGSTQCLHVNSSGVISGTGSDCGAGGGSGLTVGTTAITGGTNGRVEYNNSGVVGEMTTSGTGTVLALTASPTFTGTVTTPALTISGIASGAQCLQVNGSGVVSGTGSACGSGGGGTYTAGTGLTLTSSVFSVNNSQNISTLSNLTSNGLIKTTSGNGTLATAVAGTDYITPYSSQTANTFLASPNGSAGTPTFRAIVAADIPTLNQNTTGTATTATNIAGGLGGSIPYQTAAGTTTMLANGTAGEVLQSNGTTLAPSWAAAGGGSGTVTTSGSPSANQIASFSGSTAISGISVGSNGQVLTSNGTTVSFQNPAGVPLNQLSTPTGNLSLTTGLSQIIFSGINLTGTSNFLTINDLSSNSSSGFGIDVSLTSGSSMKPADFDVNGNGVVVSNAGVLAPIGTGHINADESSAFTLTGITGSTQCLQVNSAGLVSGTGSACGGGASGLTVGTTAITGGTNGRVEYNNSGVVGEMTTSGTGTVLALTASPTFTGTVTTPALTISGIASGTQCLHVNSSGVISGTGSDCGSGGSGNVSVTTKGDLQGYDTAPNRIPVGSNGQVLVADSTQALGLKWATLTAGAGGSTTQLQYNNTGSLAGISAFTSDGTNLTISSSGTLTNNGINNIDGGILKNGPSGYQWTSGNFDAICDTSIANLPSPYNASGCGSSAGATETFFSHYLTFSGASTATTLDGTHAGVQFTELLDIYNNGSAATLKLRACSALSSNTCTGATTLWSATLPETATSWSQGTMACTVMNAGTNAVNAYCISRSMNQVTAPAYTVSLPSGSANWIIALSVTYAAGSSVVDTVQDDLVPTWVGAN